MTSHRPSTQPDASSPQSVPGRLRRRRLIDQLNSYLGRRLILVQAPAGYGKTTLLTDFVEQLDQPVCWLHLTSTDGDPRQLAEALWTELTRRFRRLHGEIEPAALTDLAPVGIARLLAQVVRDHIDERFLLVLDDIQQVNTSAPATSLLDGLLADMPPNVQFAMVGRALPQVNLAPLVVEAQVGGLGPRDLALTREETRQLARTRGLDRLDEVALEQIYQRTEGWVAGILMFLLAGPEGDRMALPGQQHGPAGYLMDAIVSRQPARVKQFLLGSSVLPIMTPADCDRLLERDDSAEQLAHLVQTGMFTHPLYAEGGRYEYHPLLRQALLEHLAEHQPDELARLRLRAADLSTRNGAQTTAFDLYAAAGLVEQAAATAEAAAPELYARGHYQTITDWAEWLISQGAQAPIVYLYAASPVIDMADYASAERWLEAAQRAIGSNDDIELRTRLLATKARLAHVQGQHRQALEIARAALAGLGDLGAPGRRVACLRIIGTSLLRLGEDLPTAAEAIQGAISFSRQAGNIYLQALSLIDLSSVHDFTGNMMESYQASRQAHELLVEYGATHSLSISFNNLAVMAHSLGRFEEAERMFIEALRIARLSAIDVMEAVVHLGLGDLLSDVGLSSQAGDQYGEALHLAHQLDDRRLLRYGYLQTAQLHRRNGTETLAAEWLARAAAVEATDSLDFELSLYSLALEVRSDPEAALRRHARLAVDSLRKSSRDLLRLAWVAACGHQANGETSKAIAAFRRSLDLANAHQLEQIVAGELRHEPEMLALGQSSLADHPALGQILNRLAVGDLYAAERAEPKQNAVSPARLTLTALGTAEVRHQGTLLDSLAPQPRQLLFFLADRQPISRDRILEAFWPGTGADNQASSLYTALYSLRKILGPEIVSIQGSLYQLNRDWEVYYDVRAFEQAAEVAGSMPKTDQRRAFVAREALRLYAGEYLPEFDDPWVIERRDILERTLSGLLMQHAETVLLEGDRQQAAASLGRLVELEPMREDLHLLYWQVLLDLGRRSEIVHGYMGLARRLSDELGIEPSQELRQFYEQVLE